MVDWGELITFKGTIDPVKYSVSCIICEETVAEFDCAPIGRPPMVCDKCKAAVAHVRAELENKKEK